MERVKMIEFDGTDLIIVKMVDNATLRRALASSLAIPEDRIAVIDDVAQYPESSVADVVCVTSPVSGQFSKLVSIQTKTCRLPHDSSLDLMRQICEPLDTRCLVPDEGLNPYCMWLFVPGEAPRQVGLDPVAMDEDRYVLRTA
jgi:hypothetical protein